MDKGIYSQQTELFGPAIHQTTLITGKGSPTPYTQGSVGCLYMDEDSYRIYKCVSTKDNICIWEPAGMGCGNGVTNMATGEIISLSDSAEAPLQSMKIFGKTTQFTNNGYQLFDISRVVENECVSVHDNFITIHLGGAESEDYPQETLIDISYIIPLLKIGELYMKAYNNEASDFDVSMLYTTSQGSFEGNAINLYELRDGGNLLNITDVMLDNMESLSLKVHYDDDYDNTEDDVFCIMLYQEGDGTWEPYTGGVATPSPANPSETKSVTKVDVNVVNIENLFDANAIDKIDFVANSDGSATVIVDYDGSNYINVLPFIKEPGVYSLLYFWEPNDKYFDLSYKTIETSLQADDKEMWKDGNRVKATFTVTQKDIDSAKDYDRYVEIGLENSGYVGVTGKLTVMLYREGETQTTTIPLSTDVELRSIPDTDIRDEADSERKVKKQNVGEWRYTGGDVPEILYVEYKKSKDLLYFAFDGVKMGMKHVRTLIDGRYLGACLSNCFSLGDASNYPYKMDIASVGDGDGNDTLEFSMSVRASDLGFFPDDGSTSTERREGFINWMQSTFSENNPLIVYYPLATPIETPLPEEVIEAYKTLHTYKPNTTIYNFEGIEMSVEYAADTKAYIDNKINKAVEELSAAIITE